MARILLWCLAVVLCQPPTDLPSYLAENIQKRVDGGINPSIAVGILDGDGFHYYNYGAMSKDGKPVDEHTIYEIGSISKVFTGTLLAQSVIEGKMSLEDPINQYLPEQAQVPHEGSQAITLGSLSDHTSGLPRLPANLVPADPTNPYADYSPEQMYAFIHSYNPTREVGHQYEYSNLAQGLLGHILALDEASSYESLLIEKITEPLEMSETKISLDVKMAKNMAVGHVGGNEVSNWDIPTLAGAGAIRSSTSDMLKFLAANLNSNESSSLNKAMALTHQVRHDKAGEMRVGLGWHIKNGSDGDVYWHNGGTGGYRAFAGFVKETGKAVVVLTNSIVSIDDIGFHLLDPSSDLTTVQTADDAVEVPEEILQRYVGNYQISPVFSIQITREGTQLYGQATGQNRFELFPKTPTKFYLTAVPAEITFSLEGENVTALTLFQNGQQIVGKRQE